MISESSLSLCYAVTVMADMTLHLRKEEAKIFHGLPKDLQDGWKVGEEKGTSDERPEELMMRYQMVSFSDPKLQKLIGAARAAQTPEAFEKIASGFDFSALSHEEMAEVFFTLGTRLLGKIIQTHLQEVKNDEDLQGIAALSEIRHLLLEANASVA